MDNKNKIEDDLEALSPEEVKAIGEIEIGPSKQDQFLNKHYKKLIVGGIALMVVISTGICIATFHQQHKAAGAATLVDAAAVSAPGDVASPAGYDARTLTVVQEEYVGTPSADTAELMEGLSLLSSESTAQKGVAVLEAVAASAENDLLRARALAAVAVHYTGCISEANKEESMKKAQEAWKKVTQLPVNAYTAIAYTTLGDLAQSVGDVEGARSYYAMLAKECPQSSITRGQMAQYRNMLLDTDNPVQVDPLPKTPEVQPLPAQNPGGSSLFDQPATPGFGSGLLNTPAAPSLPLPAPTPAN